MKRFSCEGGCGGAYAMVYDRTNQRAFAYIRTGMDVTDDTVRMIVDDLNALFSSSEPAPVDSDTAHPVPQHTNVIVG